MPIHEYRCLNCNSKVTVLFRSISAVNHTQATCDRCGSKKLTRLVSRVRVVRNQTDTESGDDKLLDEMSNFDENDPRALGRFMRKMAQETGEPMGEEFDEVVSRLERGEDPEKIEQSMGDAFGGEGGMGDEGIDDYMPEPSKNTEEESSTQKQRSGRSAKRTKHKQKPKTKSKRS
jgi:putative FmdB family regulatory protein